MWGYKWISVPDHPNATSNGCVLQHRLVAEEVIGRYLTEEEVVHHVDEDKSNNIPSNLEVFATKSDHTRYHQTGIKLKNEEGIWYSPILNKMTSKQSDRRTSKDSDKQYHRASYERVCKNCENTFTTHVSKVVYCSYDCAYKANRRVSRPSKETLYTLLTFTSFSVLGNMFGVSDNSIRKWCKEYGIPSKTKYYRDKYYDLKD